MARVETRRFVAKPTPEGKRTRLPLTTTEDGQPALRCGRGDLILKGETYYFFAVGFRGSRQYRCTKHYPKPSELDGSLFSEVLAAQESASDDLAAITWNPGDTADDIRQQVDDAIQQVKDAVESVADQYSEASEAMGGDYGAGAQTAEWSQNLQDAEVMNWEARDFDDPDEGDPDARCDVHTPEADGGQAIIDPEADDAYEDEAALEQAAEDCDDCRELREPDLSDWVTELVDAATEVISNVSRDG
jgi:hypothetical protein